MSKLAHAFAKDHPALVAFITAGDPDIATTASILDALVDAGVDVIELGIPFTDPMADGPAIQAANLRALANGITLEKILKLASDFNSRHDVPLVLMGYANSMLSRGPKWFAQSIAKAGISGVICVDIPPEEDDSIGPALREVGVDVIRLATPTTDDERLTTVLDDASGFLYYVSVAGITGKQQADIDSIDVAVRQLKSATNLPVSVGFGVRTPDQAAAIAKVADGVVIGSAIIDIIAQHGVHAAAPVKTFVESLAAAVHTGAKEKQA